MNDSNKLKKLATRIVNLSGDYDSADEGLEDSVIAQVQSIIGGFCKKQQQRIAELEMDCNNYSQNLQCHITRQGEAEAELARRGEAAGEPVYQVQLDNDQWFDSSESVMVSQANHGVKTRVLFTAAQPSALPPEIVAWQYRYNHNDGSNPGEWHTVEHKSDCNPHSVYEKRALCVATGVQWSESHETD